MSSTSKKLMGITPVSGAVEAEAIDFDGTNDYLSRSTDLVGNADGKTFTFSAWFYLDGNVTFPIYNTRDPANSNYGVQFSANTNGVNVYVTTSGGTVVLNIQDGVVSSGLAVNTWHHFVISVDCANLTYAGYLNDELITWNVVTAISNNTPDFTTPSHLIGKFPFNSTVADGRLSNVYLDYTYRDLSIEANRRLFVDYDDDGGLVPASGQASLSPILYLPMDDPDDPGRNDGTGGDFTLNGTIARSGRGPNQYNAPASTFDGDSGDYLSKSSISGITDSKTATFSFAYKLTESVNQFIVWGSGNSVEIQLGDNILTLTFENSSGTEIMKVDAPSQYPILNKWLHVTLSFDLTDSGNRHLIINGVDETSSSTWSTYTNDSVDFTVNIYEIPSSVFVIKNGQLSDFYFDTTYIDLSANNPFYDVETGKPKFLGENGELPTGSSPLIYLPLRADDAGNNKGTGGDFTVNSGPYVGARGPSEFWANSAEFNGTDQYLERTSALTGASDGKQFTLIGAIKNDVSDPSFNRVFEIATPDGNQRVTAAPESSDGFRVEMFDASGAKLLEATSDTVSTTWYTFLISVDLSDNARRHFFVNGDDTLSNWGTYLDGNVEFSADAVIIGSDVSGSAAFLWDGKIGFLWFNTEYIDFSQEANRLKFFDAFNYPVDLGEDGSLPTGNQPLIYMNNDFHLGTNLGSGGDFTPQNTPTDGGFVKG